MALKDSAQTLTGKLLAWHISPKGVYESLLLQSAADVVQINFPKEAGYLLHQTFKLGKNITVMALLQTKEKGSLHPVYELISFKNDKGQMLAFTPTEKTVQVTSKVTQINYALHGAPNGAVLANGDFVHLKPEGAKLIKLIVGQELKITGELRPSFLDNRIIEAQTVDGQKLLPAAKKIAAHAPKKAAVKAATKNIKAKIAAK